MKTKFETTFKNKLPKMKTKFKNKEIKTKQPRKNLIFKKKITHQKKMEDKFEQKLTKILSKNQKGMSDSQLFSRALCIFY